MFSAASTYRTTGRSTKNQVHVRHISPERVHRRGNLHGRDEKLMEAGKTGPIALVLSDCSESF
jgi:hypothetical protein